MFTEEEKSIILEGLDMTRALLESSGEPGLSKTEFNELCMRIEGETINCPWCEGELFQVDQSNGDGYEIQEWACSLCTGWIQFIAQPPTSEEEDES